MEHECFHAGIVAQPFITGFMRRHYPFELHWAVPVRCGRDASVIGTEAEQERRVGEARSTQLSDVVLTARTHLGSSGVPYMRVVSPYDTFAAGAVEIEQPLESVELC